MSMLMARPVPDTGSTWVAGSKVVHPVGTRIYEAHPVGAARDFVIKSTDLVELLTMVSNTTHKHFKYWTSATGWMYTTGWAIRSHVI